MIGKMFSAKAICSFDTFFASDVSEVSSYGFPVLVLGLEFRVSGLRFRV